MDYTIIEHSIEGIKDRDLTLRRRSWIFSLYISAKEIHTEYEMFSCRTW